MVHKVNSGHPGGSLGCTEYFVALYNEIMTQDTSFDMDGKGEDLFFLSNGHISPVYYSVLARRGYFPVDELNTFRLLDSRLQSDHTRRLARRANYIRIIGPGYVCSLGCHANKKLNADTSLIYSLHGDGGYRKVKTGRLSCTSANNVDNLIATIDRNGQQIDEPQKMYVPLAISQRNLEPLVGLY